MSFSFGTAIKRGLLSVPALLMLAAIAPAQININQIAAPAFAPNQNGIYASPNCGTQTNCYTVYRNLRATADCSTTNGQATIGSASAAFTSADLGKIAYCLSATTGAPVIHGTVTTINSGTEITVSNDATATASGATLALGNDDGLAIHNALSAAIAAQVNLNIACGQYLIDSNLPLASVTEQPAQNYSISGCTEGGATGTTLVIGPDAITSSTTFVLGNLEAGVSFPLYPVGSSVSLSNLTITGLGLQAAAGTGAWTIANVPQAKDVKIYDLRTVSGSSCTDLESGGGEAHYERLNIQNYTSGTGSNGCVAITLQGQGNNSLSHSILAYIAKAAVLCAAGATCDLDGDYVAQDGGGGYAAIDDSSGSAQIVVRGGYYQGNGANPIFALSANTNLVLQAPIISENGSGTKIFSLSSGDNVFSGAGTSYVTVTAGDAFASSSGRFWNKGDQWSTQPTTTLPTLIGSLSEAGSGTCASNAATITFLNAYAVAPIVSLTPTTSASTGDQPTSTSATAATVHCNGATDTFNYTVAFNQF